MTSDEIFRVVKEIIGDVLLDLKINLDDVTLDDNLKNLGANSIDRMEITVMSMEALRIKVPLVEFGEVTNLRGLVDILKEKMQAVR